MNCDTTRYLNPAAKACPSFFACSDSSTRPAVAITVSSKNTNRLNRSRVKTMPDSAITATSQTAIARRPSPSRVSFSVSAENRPVRLISRVSAASARPMRRLIANGGAVPAVKISTAAASLLAKVHSQPAEIQLMQRQRDQRDAVGEAALLLLQ
jgi:hypothetical protein